jgi:hypothetical protein
MVRFFYAFLFVALVATFQGKAQTIQTDEKGPVHEAFISRFSGNLLLQAVKNQPPEPINERIPRQLDMQTEWISGYWKWHEDSEDFVWISGVWRRPPPGHQWISGFWKLFDQDWVWISGFWSKIPEQHIDYINIPPPEPLDENMAPPPTNNFFWVPGHWYFLFDKQRFDWVPGYWEEMDSQWILTPSHYVWRPGGYVYVPSYWDWNLDDRGTAYASVFIDPDYRYRVVYEPILVVKTEMLIRYLFVRYPDYLTLVHHHYHYHPDYWHTFCCLPPWWSWDTWWALSWHDHWGLWWWYTHPGYPQPMWMTKELSGIIPAPLPELQAMLSYVTPPLIVTPNGVVSRADFLHSLNRVTENDLPIVPDNRKALNRVQILARPVSIESTNILKPMGRRLPIDPHAVRPNVRKPVINPQSLSDVKIIKDDLKPRTPFKPRIPTHSGSSIWKPHESSHPPTTPPLPVRRPTWTPKSLQTAPSANFSPQDDKKLENEDLRPWKPRPKWGEPPIKRPPIYKPRERFNRRIDTRQVESDQEDSDGENEEEQGFYPDNRRTDRPLRSYPYKRAKSKVNSFREQRR